MWGQRRKVSLLLANGHPNAGLYTIGRIYDESELVVERLNSRAATDAILLQSAVASVISKDAGKHFDSLINGLTGD